MDLLSYSKKYLRTSRLYVQVQNACRELLLNHPAAQEAREYLNKRVSRKNQEVFRFGYFPKDDEIEILLEKVPQESLKKLEMVYNYHVQNDDCRVDTLRGALRHHNITLPFYDQYSNVVSIIGRTILPDTTRKNLQIQKYKYTRFKKSYHLFGLNQAIHYILNSGSVILVEGQMDCLTCHEFGIHNVVALGGTAFSRRQFDLIARYADKIYLALDNDMEGMRAQKKIMSKYGEFLPVEKILLPGNCKDIDEYLKGFGDKSILQL